MSGIVSLEECNASCSCLGLGPADADGEDPPLPEETKSDPASPNVRKHKGHEMAGNSKMSGDSGHFDTARFDGVYDEFAASVRHVVVYKLKCSEDDTLEMERHLGALPAEITDGEGDQIVSHFAFGSDLKYQTSPSQYHYALVVDFQEQDEYLSYRANKQHHLFSRTILEPIVEARASLQFDLVPKGSTIRVRRGMLRHVVLFKWLDHVGESELGSIRQGLSLLPDEIPQVVNYFYGSDLGLKQVRMDSDFDFAIVADFDNYKDYQVYRSHDAHTAFTMKFLKPAIKDRAAVQFLL